MALRIEYPKRYKTSPLPPSVRARKEKAAKQPPSVKYAGKKKVSAKTGPRGMATLRRKKVTKDKKQLRTRTRRR